MLSHYSEAQVYTPPTTPSSTIATLPPNPPSSSRPRPYPTVNCDMIETPRAGNLSGAVVAEGSYQSKAIDISNLPTGMYIMHVQEREKVHTEKFLKQ